jgi:hypothetical protein
VGPVGRAPVWRGSGRWATLDEARSRIGALGYGVIGNTEDSDSFVLGSSPGTPALNTQEIKGPDIRAFSFILHTVAEYFPHNAESAPKGS